MLIRSIEWLTILPETAEDALVRSCQLVRYFLCMFILMTTTEQRTMPAD